MTRIIDADALLKSINDNRPYNADAVIEEIEEFPTVDAVPVIRCKDCRFFKPVWHESGMCLQESGAVSECGYCYRAVRREK